MSDRIVESLNEMKQIYLESVSGQVISKRDEYLQYIEEKMKMKKKEDENKEDEDKDEEGKPNRWWDDDGDGIGYEKGEVGGKFNKKKKSMKESFSDWRCELHEKVGNVESDIENLKQKKIEERSDIKNKIDINPNVNIGEQVELSEEYIEEVVGVAAQYFYDQGLNEDGLEMVIEDLGCDKFVEYVFYISEDFLLTEARKAKKRKGGKSYEEIKAEIDAREAVKKKPTVAKKVAVSRGDEAVAKAVATQPKARPALDALARGITSATKFVQKGIERDRNARRGLSTAAQQTAQTAGKVISGVRQAGSELRKPFETTKAGRNVQAALIKGARKATKAAVNVAAKETARRKVGVKEEIETFLLEKSESQQQQKLFGLALSVKRGETPRSEVSKAVLDIVDGMSEKEIRKFAKTPHKGLPKKVED
jgi:hypothetical protein